MGCLASSLKTRPCVVPICRRTACSGAFLQNAKQKDYADGAACTSNLNGWKRFSVTEMKRKTKGIRRDRSFKSFT